MIEGTESAAESEWLPCTKYMAHMYINGIDLGCKVSSDEGMHYALQWKMQRGMAVSELPEAELSFDRWSLGITGWRSSLLPPSPCQPSSSTVVAVSTSPAQS